MTDDIPDCPLAMSTLAHIVHSHPDAIQWDAVGQQFVIHSVLFSPTFEGISPLIDFMFLIAARWSGRGAQSTSQRS